MSAFFNATIYQPFYNAFIFLIGSLPFLDAGVIIIIFTIITKLVLLPLSIKASIAQMEMKSHEKNLNDIKEKHKDNKEEYGRKQLEYYKEHGINPFSSIFILLIQLPILIGVYQVFIKSGLPAINTALLYSFVSAPLVVNMLFLNLIDISHKSLVLALLAGITTYFQASFASPLQTKGNTSKQGDLAKAMAVQMKYILPVFMAYISYIISGAVALYLITSNLFAIGQELYIKKKYHKTTIVV
ncbi:MAG TPA: YidC/Oxa1 family membrane protein insertase [Candidatus Paceibacterota bacterium]|nr:membrane protein insertase MisCB [uncultured archaeon]